jgi:hypothetical protein
VHLQNHPQGQMLILDALRNLNHRHLDQIRSAPLHGVFTAMRSAIWHSVRSWESMPGSRGDDR